MGVTAISRRDNFTKGVRDILAHRAGFRCSKPDCRAPTAGPSAVEDKQGSIGIAAHITAAAPGGPRYDSTLSSEQRGSVSNGIWLCDIHAREIDKDPTRFSTEVLHTWKQHAENEARVMLGRPVSSASLEVTMEVSLQRDANDGLGVIGQTNLPNETKLMGTLSSMGMRQYRAQAKCAVYEQHLLLGPFTSSGDGLPQRWYDVEICSYFNEPWDQPEHVTQLTGVGGVNLVGRLAHPLDPDLPETEYAVISRFACPAPPMLDEPALTTDEIRNAIELLRQSILEVEGRVEPRSTLAVGDVVKWFMRWPGLRENKGWSSKLCSPGIVEVAYSYWNGERPDVALWHVMPRSQEVRYRNLQAKRMSWASDD